MPCVIGIDGGASKTRGLLADLKGRTLASGECVGSNYQHTGLQSAMDLLLGLCQGLLHKAQRSFEDLRAACFGLAGVGRALDRERVFSSLSRRFPKDRLLLVTDADIALSGGCLSDSGVVVIAGTGSIIYGRDKSGRTARVGGYGPLLSDEGGGYALGQAGLRAIFRAHDGLDVATGIRDKVLQRLQLKDEDDLVAWAMESAEDKAAIATLASATLESHTEGDCVAATIIQAATDWLSLGVKRVAGQLDLPDRFPVVLTGGLLNHHPPYFRLLERKIHGLLPEAEMTRPKMRPVQGAVLNALVRVGVTIDDEIVRNLTRS